MHLRNQHGRENRTPKLKQLRPKPYRHSSWATHTTSALLP